jgi:hypothetical protein
MERVMEISDGRGAAVVTTTGIHVARRIGEKTVRVSWER